MKHGGGGGGGQAKARVRVGFLEVLHVFPHKHRHEILGKQDGNVTPTRKFQETSRRCTRKRAESCGSSDNLEHENDSVVLSSRDPEKKQNIKKKNRWVEHESIPVRYFLFGSCCFPRRLWDKIHGNAFLHGCLLAKRGADVKLILIVLLGVCVCDCECVAGMFFPP